MLRRTLREWAEEIHRRAVTKGFGNRPFDADIALLHSELSEAYEEYRAGHPLTEDRYDDGKPVGVPSELADVFIRLMDTCARWGVDIEKAVQEKLEYNLTRPYRHGGKIV